MAKDVNGHKGPDAYLTSLVARESALSISLVKKLANASFTKDTHTDRHDALLYGLGVGLAFRNRTLKPADHAVADSTLLGPRVQTILGFTKQLPEFRVEDCIAAVAQNNVIKFIWKSLTDTVRNPQVYFPATPENDELYRIYQSGFSYVASDGVTILLSQSINCAPTQQDMQAAADIENLFNVIVATAPEHIPKLFV